MNYEKDPFLTPRAYLDIGIVFLTGPLVVCLSQLDCDVRKRYLKREVMYLAS